MAGPTYGRTSNQRTFITDRLVHTITPLDTSSIFAALDEAPFENHKGTQRIHLTFARLMSSFYDIPEPDVYSARIRVWIVEDDFLEKHVLDLFGVVADPRRPSQVFTRSWSANAPLVVRANKVCQIKVTFGGFAYGEASIRWTGQLELGWDWHKTGPYPNLP